MRYRCNNCPTYERRFNKQAYAVLRHDNCQFYPSRQKMFSPLETSRFCICFQLYKSYNSFISSWPVDVFSVLFVMYFTMFFFVTLEKIWFFTLLYTLSLLWLYYSWQSMYIRFQFFLPSKIRPTRPCNLLETGGVYKPQSPPQEFRPCLHERRSHCLALYFILLVNRTCKFLVDSANL